MPKFNLKELFSLLLGRPGPPYFAPRRNKETPRPPAKMALLISVTHPTQLELFQENLRSQAIPFEIRNGTDIYVPEDDLATAKEVLKEGQWEY